MNLSALRQGFESELQKIATELTGASRGKIAPKNFALSAKQSDTGEPKYPIHDQAHAANALARVRQFGTAQEKSEVYKDVAKRFPALAARSDVSAVKDKVKESGALREISDKALEHLHHNEGLHDVLGLGVLAAPALDKLQASARAHLAKDKGHDATEKRQLMGEGAHAGLEVGGLGYLAAPVIAKKLLKKTWGE